MAGGESNAAIDVGVYYESLCPDSIRWIKQQLLPQYDVLKDYIRVTFVPYGKASVSGPIALCYVITYYIVSRFTLNAIDK